MKDIETGKYMTQHAYNKWENGEDCAADKMWTDNPDEAATFSDDDAPPTDMKRYSVVEWK